MSKTRLAVSALASLLVVIGAFTQASAQQEPTREIAQITGDLYRAQNNNHFTVFLVTDEGIVLADPINSEFSTWLKSELAKHFDVPVRYVVYSHHHGDHSSGGAVFEDTARFVGHEDMLKYLALPPDDLPLPLEGQYRFAAEMDVDGNERITREEAKDEFQTSFEAFDANGDGELSGGEVKRGPVSHVRVPNITYSDRITLSLGGKTVELESVGEINHSSDLSVIIFPDERAMHIVDFVTFKRLPYREMDWENGMYAQWLAAIRHWEEEAKNYEYISAGHGPLGNADGVTEWREYFEALEAAVAAAIDEGQTLEEMRASIELPAYEDWAGYFWLNENVLAMYHFLTDTP